MKRALPHPLAGLEHPFSDGGVPERPGVAEERRPAGGQQEQPEGQERDRATPRTGPAMEREPVIELMFTMRPNF